LGRAPHGAEALGALPKLGFVKCDLQAHANQALAEALAGRG